MEFGKVFDFLKKNYWVFLLIFVVLVAFWLRGIPGTKVSYPRLMAIDPYFIFRMGEHIIEHGDLPEHDSFAQWKTTPGGPDRKMDYPVTLWIYPIMYFILNPLLGGFQWFSWYWVGVWAPAFFGALQVLFLFFLVREMFGTRVALVSSAFLAFVPGILYRVSAGFIEKEPVAGVFMVLALLFFVKGFKEKEIKRDVSFKEILLHPLRLLHRSKISEVKIGYVKAVVYGLIAGFFLYLMQGSWGGVRILIILIPGFVFFSILLNRYNKNLMLSYIPMFLFYLLASRTFGISPSLYTPEYIINYVVIILLLVRFGIGRFNLVEERYRPYVIPVLVGIGLFVFAIVAYIDVDLGIWAGNIIAQFSNPISIGVIASTVAESQTAPAFMANSISSFGNTHAISSFNLPGFLVYFSIIYFSFLGVFLMVYEFFIRRRVRLEFILMVLFFVFTLILAMGAMRLAFVFAFPVAITAGYFLVRGCEWVLNKGKGLGRNLTYLKIIVGVFMGIVVITNFASGFIMANGIGSSLDDSWYSAMIWLRDNTPEDSVLLEWWDFGWWFHYVAKKITLVDGGYHPQTPTQDIAQFFTRPISDRSLNFLKHYEVDYVMVSPDLIPKFGAMSKIANWGKKVDVLPVFYLTNRYVQGEKTLMEYSMGNQQILVAFSTVTQGNETNLRNITAMYKTPQGQAYIRDIGIGNQIIRTDRPNSIAGMVYLAGNAVIFAPEAVEECMFIRLYLFNGFGLEKYFEKVYDERGMKIYRVKYEDFPENITGEYVNAKDLMGL